MSRRGEKREGRTSRKEEYGQEYRMLIGGDGKLQGNAEPPRGSTKEKEELNALIIALMQKS